MADNQTTLTFTVPPDYDGAMLKSFLRRACHVSAHLLTVLKNEKNGITRNGQPIRAIDPVKTGERIELFFPEECSTVEPVCIPLSVIYEDKHLLLLDKPPGMPVHPTSCGHTHDTLANAVSAYMRTKGESYKVRPVNRLDQDTSGIVILAKNAFCAHALAQNVSKTYIAVAQGRINGSKTIQAPIRIKPGHVLQRETAPDGQRAITHYTALEYKQGHTLLALRLETGRTHQIRVHMACAGHPLAGDDLYGGNTRLIARQALHCKSVSFVHPVTGARCTYEAPVPRDMRFIAFADFKI